MNLIYRVKNWTSFFENYQSKKTVNFSWLSWHNGAHNDRLTANRRRLLRHPGGIEAYGVMVIICEVISRNPSDLRSTGELRDEHGPLSLEDLEEITGCSVNEIRDGVNLLAKFGFVEMLNAETGKIYDPATDGLFCQKQGTDSTIRECSGMHSTNVALHDMTRTGHGHGHDMTKQSAERSGEPARNEAQGKTAIANADEKILSGSPRPGPLSAPAPLPPRQELEIVLDAPEHVEDENQSEAQGEAPKQATANASGAGGQNSQNPKHRESAFMTWQVKCMRLWGLDQGLTGERIRHPRGTEKYKRDESSTKNRWTELVWPEEIDHGEGLRRWRIAMKLVDEAARARNPMAWLTGRLKTEFGPPKAGAA